MLRFVVLLAVTLPLAAFQYPGQQPPVGQYPPGQRPGGPLGNGGISLPSRGHKKSKKPTDQQPTLTAEGRTVTNDGKKLVVATEDGRTLTMTLTPQTKWVRSGATIPANQVAERTTVRIEAAEDDEAFLTATTVELLKDVSEPVAAAQDPGSAQKQTAPAASSAQTAASDDEEMAKPTILKAPDAPGRPVLKRGASKTSARGTASDDDVASEQPAEVAKTSAPKSAPKDGPIDFTIDGNDTAAKKHANVNDQLIDRTREWAMTFTNGLPNFVCSQSTTRYYQPSRSEGFQAVDVVTAKVLYEDGREKYSEIAVGGKRTNKGMMEVGGSTSTGEFASILGGLFQAPTHTEFKFFQSATVGKEPAAIFDFKVKLHNSNWTIQVGGQTLRPAYSGSIWIDKATAQVRRIEMQADNVPKDFPDDAIASAVDYEEVSLGTSKFLLPVHAENLSCERGNTICTKNVIEFRDYHKYSGESTIEFK